MSGTSNGAQQALPVSRTVDKAADFANYFCTYAYLYHQKEMLSDKIRMDAYYSAIFENKHHFEGKTVLDVGTGSGILAIWCAQAGARKVYAVEATKMSDHARKLVVGNGVDGIVEVIEGSMEEVSLPEKVDVIISEWMGYFLLRESMFDSVIYARDHFLKPNGIMYPSHARMWLAPIRSNQGETKWTEFEHAMDGWHSFVDDTIDFYGVDMSVLTDAFTDEQRKYYLQTSVWNNLYPHQVIGAPAIIKEIDCHTATLDEIASVFAKYTIPITVEQARFNGFAGWFDVHFRGNASNPVSHEVELTTAPSVENLTHWGQQVFLLYPSEKVMKDDVLDGTFVMTRSKDNHRLMDVQFTFQLRLSSTNSTRSFTSNFYIE